MSKWTIDRLRAMLSEYENPKRKLNDRRLADKWGLDSKQFYEKIDFIRLHTRHVVEIVEIDGVKITRYSIGYASGVRGIQYAMPKRSF